ncbi:hypothetical protein ACWDSF_06135 [Nocardia beijingensis]
MTESEVPIGIPPELVLLWDLASYAAERGLADLLGEGGEAL